MENIFKVEKKATYVSPSGVEVDTLGLEGKHQALITVQDDKKRADGLKQILIDCISRIGDKTILSANDIDRLLSFDRKFFLWKIRELSNEDNDLFVFDYEFPVKNKRKLKQRFSIDFNEESFPIKPAKWVEERMYEEYAETIGVDVFELKEDDKKQALKGEFPIMYQSYEEMMESNYKQEITLPECGVEISYTLSTGVEENKFAKQKDYQVNSHTQLLMRKPVYDNKELAKTKGKDEVIQAVPLDKLSNIDIEHFRKHLMSTEGAVDSMVVVQSDEDASLINQVDLLQTPAFFFASLAL